MRREDKEPTLKEYQEFFQTCENVLKLGIGERRRFYNLGDTAESAIGAREYKKARQYALELLALAPKYKDDWYYGNAIHIGHTVLGRVALIKGSRAEAKQHLLLSARVPSTPQLSTNGPRLALAKALLARGERKVVLQYLELIGVFWDAKATLLKSWKAEIKAGRIPSSRRWNW